MVLSTSKWNKSKCPSYRNIKRVIVWGDWTFNISTSQNNVTILSVRCPFCLVYQPEWLLISYCFWCHWPAVVSVTETLLESNTSPPVKVNLIASVELFQPRTKLKGLLLILNDRSSWPRPFKTFSIKLLGN